MKRTLLTSLIVFLIFAAFLYAVQFATPNLADHDGYYHIKMAYLMRTQGFKPHFIWLPLTVLNPREFVDHHFAFHIALIPFTFGDLRLGAKWASVVFPALAFWAIWWLLRGRRLPLASLWAFGLLVVSEAFIYRMSMPRAQSLSLAVLALALHWLLTGKYGRLIPLAFMYVWLYNAFPLIVLLAGAYSVSVWLVEGRISWKPVAYTALGVALGLLVNPYFPDNLIFIFRHILPKAVDPTSTNVGSEWFPYNTKQLIENSGVALAAFLLGVMALGYTGKRMNTATTTGFFLAVGFGAMLFQSRRFIEYFPPFAVIFTALSCQPLLEAWLKGEKGPSGLSNVANWISRRLGRWLSVPSARRALLTLVMVGVLFPTGWLNLQASSKNLTDSARPYQTYAEASIWLRDNTPAGSRVFQTDWDDFPRQFFYNTHNTYLIGLDPTYMQLYQSDLYELWVKITQGDVESPSAFIRQQFGADYVFTDLNHKDFIQRAEKDPNLKETYRDEYAIVYQVIP